MTAGAFAKKGEVSIALVLCVAVIGSLGGDLLWFEAGRRWGSRIMRVIFAFSSDPQHSALKAREVFGRLGLCTLFIAKFVPGLDGVTPPLAGLEGASRITFLAYDAIGSLLYAAAYVGCGYLFAEQFESVAASMARFGNALGALIGILLTGFVLWRAWILLHMLRHLRLRRITPLLLHERLNSGEEVALIDLLDFEDGRGSRPGIAGAVRIAPAHFRSRSKVVSPKELGIVLYCSSSGELTSARVAVSLRKKGVFNVWVPEGGLEAWEKAGLPVTMNLSTENEAAERLDIRILRREL
jgi:membrane protein DedA with SNARE-associated domain/rhodanese-related sulfurtransferase